MNWRSPKLIIFTTVFVDLLGFGIIIPILPVIAAQYPIPGLHVRGSVHGIGLSAGLMLSSFSLLQMLFAPFWGRLSDRHGRRPILLLSLAGSSVSYLIFAFSGSFWTLLGSRVLAGICCANISTAQAYISDLTSHKDRTAGMGLIGMAFGLGFALGPVLGGGATHFWTKLDPGAAAHMGPGLVAGAICGLNFLAAIFRLPESLPRELRGKVHFRRFASTREALANLRHPAIGPLIALFFLVTFAFANLEVSFSLYVRRVLGMDQEKVYGFFVFYGLIMAFAQGFLVRRAVRRIPEQMLMIPGIALLALGMFLLPFGAHVPFALATMCLMATGQGIANPCIMSLISRSATARTQGNVLGTSQSASSLARIVGPMFGGIVFDFGPAWPFWIAALVMAGAALWANFTRLRLRTVLQAAPMPMRSDSSTASTPSTSSTVQP